jgi:hypothetical protein
MILHPKSGRDPRIVANIAAASALGAAASVGLPESANVADVAIALLARDRRARRQAEEQARACAARQRADARVLEAMAAELVAEEPKAPPRPRRSAAMEQLSKEDPAFAARVEAFSARYVQMPGDVLPPAPPVVAASTGSAALAALGPLSPAERKALEGDPDPARTLARIRRFDGLLRAPPSHPPAPNPR